MNKEELVELLAKSQDAILKRVDSKLQELKRSISEDQEECLSSVVKRVKEHNTIKWKKVGNEKQFKFNQSVEARFDSAISAIEKKKLDKAKKELEEGEEPGSLVDRKDTGETTAPISFLQEDLISQPSDVFDFEKSSGSCLFKVGSLREHVDFWSNSIRASDFIINTIVEGYRIPFFDLPENFGIPNRSSAFKYKDFVNEAISELIERGCVKEVLIPPKFINPLHVLQQSVWEPSQVGTWLGFHLDFSLNFITVPLPKITKFQESISRILTLRFVNAKDLASVAGQLNSMFLAIGNIVRLMSRAMYAQISAQNSWFSNFYLEDSVVEELVFWQSNLDHLSGRHASDTGYGGYIVELGPQVSAQGVWSADLAKESSTMREILAVRKVLQSFAPNLAGLCVKMAQGQPECCALDSRFWNPYCEAMDTFTRSWDFDNNWVCPPPQLVPRTLRHMRSCCAQGTLIVPLGRSAPFWPVLTTDGSHLAHFVEDWVDLSPLKTTFCMGRHSAGGFGRENLNFKVLAVRINFRSVRELMASDGLRFSWELKWPQEKLKTFWNDQLRVL
ncbi:unnamed protein product, partial [Porites lobata]